MSLAIKYAMMKRKKECHGGKMAEGGDVDMGMLHDEPEEMSPLAKGMKKAFHAPGYAEGGEVEEKASGYQPMPCKKCGHVSNFDHELENQDEGEEEDMIGRIMKKRKGYSEGGKVANEDKPEADFEENEFDDLVKDDDLSFHETGKNSGDEIGDEAEDDDRRDIVSKIMKSRKKKDKMPNPA